MDPQYLRAYTERAAASAEPGTPIRFVASTENVARDGLVISADGWQLDNFRANPTILWSHDYMGNRPPIGKATNLEVKDGKLFADVVFDQADEFARSIERKYRDGFLNAVSVGWDTVQMEPPKGSDGAARITQAELLDISAVNVPGDPGALMERQKRALAVQAHDILKIVEPVDETPNQNPDTDHSTARATWQDTAASMVRLFWPFTQRPDEDREKEYRKIVREYGRHGKTAPEFLAANEVDALSVDDIRGHFLEGEPELHAELFAAMGARAGAVLSKRNTDALDQAIALLQGIRVSAQKEADQTEEERAAEASIRELRGLFVKD